MELRVLKHFLKIAETENVTQAAKELNVAQPHLTRQVQALEEELGARLFVRQKKRLHITDEGRFLKQQAEQIVKLVEKTERQIREMHSADAGTLFLGAIETVGTAVLPEWIASFKEAFPNVNYNIWSGNSKDVTERLDKGLVDLALVREPFDVEKFNSLHLRDEKWIVLISREHILSQKSSNSISLRELASEPLMVPTQRMEEVQSWFAAQGLTAHIRCGFAPLLNGVVFAEKNLGIAIVPESARAGILGDRLIIKEFDEERITGVSLIWQKEYELPAVARHFLEFIRNAVLPAAEQADG